MATAQNIAEESAGCNFDAEAYASKLVSMGADPEAAQEIAKKTASARSQPVSADAPTPRKRKAALPKQLDLDHLKEKAKIRAGAYDDPNATYQLPLWPESAVRSIPNHIARSSLFAPIGKKKGKRARYDNAIIKSRSDVLIRYSGPQLDMADCDVFMQALHLARSVPLGQPVYFQRSNFLAALNKSDAGPWYDWLEGALVRLMSATLYIKTKRYVVGDPDAEPDAEPVITNVKEAAKHQRGLGSKRWLHLIAGMEYDETLESYYLLFDPRILALFQNQEFSLVDWEARFALEKRVDLAKWLQNYVSSQPPGPHNIGVKLLKEWCGYTSPINKFRTALSDAMSELERVGIIAGATIKPNDVVLWTRLRKTF